MPLKILSKIKEFVGTTIAIITLMAMITGYVVYLNNIQKDIDTIKSNELIHIQASLNRLEQQKEADNARMTAIEKSISRIEGILSK